MNNSPMPLRGTSATGPFGWLDPVVDQADSTLPMPDGIDDEPEGRR
jgi:hypothetical protein